MTRISKRSFVHLAGWGAVAALAVVAGCSKKEETTTTTTVAPASAPMAAASAAPPAASAPLKVAFAYVGPVGDGGWTFAHDNARKALEKDRKSVV